MATRQVIFALAVSAFLVAGVLGAIDSHKITSLPGQSVVQSFIHSLLKVVDRAFV